MISKLKKYFIFLILTIAPIIACVTTEGTIYENPDTSNDKAIIQSDESCDDCTLESQ